MVAKTAAAGTAALVYLVLSGRLSSSSAGGAESPRRRDDDDEDGESKRKRWPERAPASWREAAAVAARTVGFTYRETLGRWPIGDIAFGIRHYMRVQGNLQHEYTGRNCVPMEGPATRQELIVLLRCLRLCMFFAKKPYEVFLEFGGYGQSDILITKSKARVMKPSFTIVRDGSTKSFILFIRGATSVKDRLTAATAAEVPFHHVLLKEGRVSNVVVGHAHCGMVAAARWIADQAIPCLNRAVEKFPDYRIKIIGHSMGAGIASLLTYMLRENKKLSSSSCIAFGPAACMTWDLAESGKDFVTTVVNRDDLVPSFGKVSAANLHTEVMGSSWAHDLQEQIRNTRILGFVNRSVTFMQSQLPFISNPSSKVADVDMMLSGTSEFQVNMTLSADAHATVKKYSALYFCSSVHSNRKTLESLVNPIQNITALMSTYVGTYKDTQEHKNQKSDTKQIDKQDKGTDEENLQQFLEALRSSPSASQEPLQFYPPGRIMHMVVLPDTKGPSSIDQSSHNEFVSLYQTPRSMYSKIRLARSMIKDHYMPRYIETMEMLVDKLEEEDSHR
uniref:Fungal lipase-type domain-containing protein n=1 Tax=Leersia perrieri TaxID=77586 RepID=A0A0D9XUZ2_9ORYZ